MELAINTFFGQINVFLRVFRLMKAWLDWCALSSKHQLPSSPHSCCDRKHSWCCQETKVLRVIEPLLSKRGIFFLENASCSSHTRWEWCANQTARRAYHLKISSAGFRRRFLTEPRCRNDSDPSKNKPYIWLMYLSVTWVIIWLPVTFTYVNVLEIFQTDESNSHTGT